MLDGEIVEEVIEPSDLQVSAILPEATDNNPVPEDGPQPTEDELMQIMLAIEDDQDE